MYNYLFDPPFLRTFDRLRHKEQYVRITALDYQEYPIKSIECLVDSGSLNINGDSPLRRTCNLNGGIVTKFQRYDDLQTLFSINKKVKIEIGFKNRTDLYRQFDMLWFPLGIYVICDISLSNSLRALPTIGLTLKDKMCLLNGEIGGTLPATVDIDKYDVWSPQTGKIESVKISIPKIIEELVHHFGGEELHRIIINGISKYAQEIINSGDKEFYVETQWIQGLMIKKESKQGEKITPQTILGYRKQELYYAGTLTANKGETICSVLDKLKNYLGNHEYFYDVYGNFIFQEKKDYVNTSQSTMIISQLNSSQDYTKINNIGEVYSLEDNELVISTSNSPQYQNIKNDFIIWGERKTKGKSTPIRYHLAIDKKPTISENETAECVIQRIGKTELSEGFDIIQLPYKILRLASTDNDLDRLPLVGETGRFYLVENEDESNRVLYHWDETKSQYVKDDIGLLKKINIKDWRTKLLIENTDNLGRVDSDYQKELINEWGKVYDLEKGCFKESALESPELINYFLDFINSDSLNGKMGVSTIGKRTKVISDNNINCLFEPEIPDFEVIRESEYDESRVVKNLYVLSDETFNQLQRQRGFNSAFEYIKTVLYEYLEYENSISITTTPIYHMEPNTVVQVNDPQTQIYGRYIVKSISIPLDVSGTMSLGCNKIINKI